MRRIRIVTCALAMVFTSLMPASAQGPDFTVIDVPGASFTLPRGINPEGDIVGFYGVVRPLMASCFARAPSSTLMSLAPQPPSPSGSTLAVTSLASTLPGAPFMVFYFTRALLPPLMFLAPLPPWPVVSTLGATSWVGTSLGVSLMASCSTRRVTSPPSMSLAPQPPRL